MSDTKTRLLQRAAHQNPNDVERLWSYIRSLERALGGGVDDIFIQELLDAVDYKSQQMTWEEVLRDCCAPLERKEEAVPFWIVSGSFVRPSIIYAIVLYYPENNFMRGVSLPEHHAIWGYQYREPENRDGFGSYGATPKEFFKRHEDIGYYFKTKIAALAFLQQHVAHSR